MPRFLPLPRRLAGTGLRLAYDAVAESFGGALPVEPGRATALENLRDILARNAVEPGVDASLLRSTRILDVHAASSNCNNVVVAIAAEEGSGLPSSLFVKLPSEERITRLFCTAIDIWRLECRFFSAVAPRVPVRTPRTYAAVARGTRFVLVQENLNEDPSVRLFTNADMLEGPDLELARRCLSTFARLHASHAGLDPAEREALLPISGHPFLSPVMRGLAPLLNKAAVDPCRKKAPERFPEDIAALFRRAMEHWDAMIEWWFSEPLALIHGDSHLGNFFVSGDEMGMLDFQAAQWGKGIRDVQYFLIDSLPADVLATNEEALIRHYLSELRAEGVVLSFEEAWGQYRAYSFQTLMTIVVAVGLGTMSERDDVMEEILSRAVAAVRRLDFEGWLEDEIIRPS